MRPFAEAIEATGFPKRFMIEVTEDAFVTKTHFQDEILPIFRKLGVKISIDDFGIGYSSLSALADITADEIKIDRSFITDIHKRPRSQGILRAIESLSEALGMTVIAEGLESFEELAYLQAATKIRLRPGLLLLEADFPGRPQAGDPARQRGARQPGQPAGTGKPSHLFARRRLSPLRAGRLPWTGISAALLPRSRPKDTRLSLGNRIS
jgi:predicted signal transduction protein with EAL and GGDEF domain